MFTRYKANKSLGAVPPFGSVFGVQTYMDPSLMEQGEIINFNVGLRTHSVTMKGADYLEIEKPKVLKFTDWYHILS